MPMTTPPAGEFELLSEADGWTLMATLPDGSRVWEDFASMTGDIAIMARDGTCRRYRKSHAPGAAHTTGLYRGHTLDDMLDSDIDLLGSEILALGDDPTFEQVAACLPPIDRMLTYTFVGTRDNFDKVGFAYGGRTPTFDPAIYAPDIRVVRTDKAVGDGLVGGWLPCLRFVYPSGENWTEMLAFAPRRTLNGNPWMQPVWYRVAHIEAGHLKWVRYIDSYVPFPPRREEGPDRFYVDLQDMEAGWNTDLSGAMSVEIPETRLADMARHSLVRSMMTRFGADPKYGVMDRNYGGSEHDGFPDTFNTDVLALCDWGLLDLAGCYIANYFGRFVRDDGAILYRGPETGQYGRILAVVAQFVEQGGDVDIVLRHRQRIDALADVLLRLRDAGRQRPSTDPAHGLLAAWSEADSCLDPDPARYMQPYFGNSTEAVRGFRDLGRVWTSLGFVERGAVLTAAADELDADVQRAIERSILRETDPPCLPPIAGVAKPPHIAVATDRLDPMFRGYRSYMEMLFSGTLTRDQVAMVATYRAAHRDMILGLPTAYGYNTHEVAGFLTYGHAYGLLQHDFVPAFLLALHSLAAHQYTRGTWTAPETRSLNPGVNAAPYCVPAQLTVPMLLRWMLAFEDPQTQMLCLCKGVPRQWYFPGSRIAAQDIPTRSGRMSFSLDVAADWSIRASLDGPTGEPRQVQLRLRLPKGRRIVSAHGGNARVDHDSETVFLDTLRAELTILTKAIEE